LIAMVTPSGLSTGGALPSFVACFYALMDNKMAAFMRQIEPEATRAFLGGISDNEWARPRNRQSIDFLSRASEERYYRPGVLKRPADVGDRSRPELPMAMTLFRRQFDLLVVSHFDVREVDYGQGQVSFQIPPQGLYERPMSNDLFREFVRHAAPAAEVTLPFSYFTLKRRREKLGLHAKSERQGGAKITARCFLPDFQGMDELSRHLQAISELGLGPAIQQPG